MPVHLRYNQTMSIDTTVRAEYRKRIQQRQTVVFGTICGVLALLLIVGLLIWTGLVPAPFNRGFSEPTDDVALIPCPIENTTPVELSSATVRVYNSTTKTGVAGQVGEALTGLGVTVAETANWSGEKLPESVRFYTGENGVPAAYTLRAYFPGSTIHFDPSNDTEVIDVVIGADWTEMVTAPTEEEKAAALEPIEGCQPVN